MKYLVLFFVLNAVASSASQSGEVIVGPGAFEVDPVAMPQVCHVYIQENRSGTIYDCSGTLTGRSQITTAAHCFSKTAQIQDFKIVAHCGKERRLATSLKLPAASNWVSPAMPERKFDVAVLGFGRSYSFSPISVAQNRSRYFEGPQGNLKAGVSCTVLGYGDNSIEKSGVLLGWKPKGVEVSDQFGYIDIRDPLPVELETSVAIGDSGGPLLCQQQGAAPELVGIVSRSLNDTQAASQGKVRTLANVFSPTWLNLDLFSDL